MKNKLNLLAFDLGSSNGRGIWGRFDGERIELEELCRFTNGPIRINGMIYWDVLNIYGNMLQIFSKFQQLNIGSLSCFGIDAWGNDYGLLDRNLQLISNVRSARHTTKEDMEAVHKIIPGLDIYKKTGLSSYSINTLYQLYRRVRENDPAVKDAYAMLMIPDLLAFFCTGELHSEYTISTTTMMYSTSKKDWARDLLHSFNIPEYILQPIQFPGTLAGCLSADVAEETGVGQVPCALVGSHDTASAVAALPIRKEEKNYAFCSSGTWSLFGMETEVPVLSEELYYHNFSNEGTVQGGFRPINNITGMWILQECMKKWAGRGRTFTYEELAEAVRKAPPFRSIIDVEHRDFFEVGDMPVKIQEYCRRTGQEIPETYGEITRCIYESLALKYRWAMEWFDQINGHRLEKLYIMGGGARNEILNQMAADCLGRSVITGPVEAACMGNLLMQAMALGELKNLDELRQIVRNSSVSDVYQPCKDRSAWDEAYHKYQELCKNQEGGGIL